LVIIYTWLIQAGWADTGTGGMADTSTMAYTGRYGGYWHSGLYRQVWLILAQWLIQAGIADTGTMTFAGWYG